MKHLNELPVPEPVTLPMNFFEHLRISTAKPEAIPDAVVKIHGMPISTRKNLTLLSGASKAGKTAITSVLCAGGIQTYGMDGSASIEVAENVDGKAVIHIDTEQSRYHHQNNLRSIVKRANLTCEPEYYQTYNIRELPLTQYKIFLESLLEKADEIFGGVHLMIIDGIADFIVSVNDEVESNSIVSYFEKLAIKYDTPIIFVLHVNPGTEKERGHLGSQLQRKCESVLSIKKEGDTSVLEAKFLRNGASGQFSPVYYQFDANKGYHTFMDACEADGRNRALRELAEQVFTQAITYVTAMKRIEEIGKCVDRTARRKLKDMLDIGVVEKQEVGNSVYYQLAQTLQDEETPF
ncbi:MAG: AAA family ATPase [Chitinophagales bacterium]|nr:AAA family ATPase [Chitinophagales bacterium]